MTTIKDYGYDSRQKLIHRQANLPLAQRKRDWQRCIEEGMSEHLAANVSQYHPVEEWDTAFGRFTTALVIMVVVGLLLILANSAYAVTVGRSDLKDAQGSESAIVACLNGGEMVLSDGTRWMCMPVGVGK